MLFGGSARRDGRPPAAAQGAIVPGQLGGHPLASLLRRSAHGVQVPCAAARVVDTRCVDGYSQPIRVLTGARGPHAVPPADRSDAGLS